jgi:hypothetical protein
VFISTPSFLVEANFNASAMQFGSNDAVRHDIRVVNLAGMDGFVAVNEVVAATASASSPSSTSCDRGIDGAVAHGRWQPAFMH